MRRKKFNPARVSAVIPTRHLVVNENTPQTIIIKGIPRATKGSVLTWMFRDLDGVYPESGEAVAVGVVRKNQVTGQPVLDRDDVPVKDYVFKICATFTEVDNGTLAIGFTETNDKEVEREFDIDVLEEMPTPVIAVDTEAATRRAEAARLEAKKEDDRWAESVRQKATAEAKASLLPWKVGGGLLAAFLFVALAVALWHGYGNTPAPVAPPVATTWYEDVDGDGYGDPAAPMKATAQPTGYVADNTDCDDTNDAVHPGATEIYNELDDDCDNVVNEGTSEPGTSYEPPKAPPAKKGKKS